jgi:cell division transport system permease protein
VRTPIGTLLDEGNNDGVPFVVGLIAVLVYIAVVLLAAMLLIGGTADRWRGELSGRLTVQLDTIAEPQARESPLAQALSIIRARPEVERAEPIPEGKLAALLQPWLGEAPLASALPLPTVIEIELKPQARDQSARIRDRLRADLPDATIDGGPALLEPALRLMGTIERLVLFIVAVLASTLAAAVIFATHARLDARREAIELLHLLGADDLGIIKAIAWRALRTSALGAATGFVLAGVTLFAFARVATVPGTEELAELSLSSAAWVGIALLPLIAASIAVMTAMLAARRTLAALP